MKNDYFNEMVGSVNPEELQLKKTNASDKEVLFLD